MLYLTGIHALNLPCSLETSGDWHTSALKWKELNLAQLDDSIYLDYGIELGKHVPEHDGTFAVADHLRALLDLIQGGQFLYAQGAKNDFICNPRYHAEFFDKVYMLNNTENWPEVDRFMHKEFGKEWRLWKNGKNNINT